ncbi:MAG: holo-ACP synthase [Candidatus Kapabacteria bacterium]|nr:holo-ACP synthase [Candidatus Kapabacteria bacterium]
MIIGIGTDFVEVRRIQEMIEQYGAQFLRRVFTQAEQDFCNAKSERMYLHYAARFAFKEACSKAMGTGVADGFEFKDCEVVSLPNGKPEVRLHGVLAERWNTQRIMVTLTHTEEHALAFVVIEHDT